jgi:hypothetical protein
MNNAGNLTPVEACITAANEANEESKRLKLDSYNTRMARRIAYRNAMPTLSSHQEICDFIACVTHGLLIELIDENMANKLLYGAQVAITALRREPALKSSVKKPIPGKSIQEKQNHSKLLAELLSCDS